MNRRIIFFIITLFLTIGLLAGTYTVSGIGSQGDPFVRVDGKITFVTNLNQEAAPIGTKIEIYNLQERGNVNFAEGRLVDAVQPAAPVPQQKNIYTVSGIGRGGEGDPFVLIDGKVTFVTNLKPQEAPQGTSIEIYNLQERGNVNFAEGRLVDAARPAPVKEQEKVYTISGIGRGGEGDPYVFIDEKVTFVTNLTPQQAPAGTKITIYELVERGNVNFAQGALLDAEKKSVPALPADVFRIAGTGSQGDPFVRINDKITFITNLTPQQAPQGTPVQVYNLQERANVNFASGRVYIPPKEEEKKEVKPEEKKAEITEPAVNGVIEVSITMQSADGTGMGFYGRYLVYVPGTETGQTVKVRIESIEDHIVRGSRVE